MVKMILKKRARMVESKNISTYFNHEFSKILNLEPFSSFKFSITQVIQFQQAVAILFSSLAGESREEEIFDAVMDVFDLISQGKSTTQCWKKSQKSPAFCF